MREQLQAAGHSVTARWLAAGREISDDQFGSADELARRYALDDLADITTANLCIFFTEEPRGAISRYLPHVEPRHAEFGLAVTMGRECWIVGPLENVFYTLAPVRRFESWQAAYAALQAIDDHGGQGNEQGDNRCTVSDRNGAVAPSRAQASVPRP